MNLLIQSFESLSNWIREHLLNLLCGYLFSMIGYFFEIKGAVHVMWLAIAFDLIAGITASTIRRKEKFSMDKFFTAIGRAIGVTVFVGLLYAMDKEMHQTVAASYYIAAYLISGFYAWSFLTNMDEMFGGRIFKLLKNAVVKNVEKETGVNINETQNG